VTKRSGKSCIVIMRYAAQVQLRNAVFHWARVAVLNDPKCRSRYAALRAHHPSNNFAKLPFDFSVRVPRTQLRPRYGDGFDGAPLTGRRPRGEGRAGGGGADDPARSANPASAGAGES